MPAATKGGGRAKVKILGHKESAANIMRMSPAVRRAFFDQIVEIAGEMLRRAEDVYVPVLSGDLKGTAAQEIFPGRFPSTTIGFGGPAAPYAGLQHENVFFKHRAPQQAKYLEKAVEDFEPTMAAKLAIAVRAETELYRMTGGNYGRAR
jgi:hypothetical protein